MRSDNVNHGKGIGCRALILTVVMRRFGFQRGVMVGSRSQLGLPA